MVEAIERIACAALCVSPWIDAIGTRMSSVAFAVCVASDFTSEATPAKPFPASPARAASIVALSASRHPSLAPILARSQMRIPVARAMREMCGDVSNHSMNRTLKPSTGFTPAAAEEISSLARRRRQPLRKDCRLQRCQERRRTE
jgi:hypothetical protein